MSDTHPASSCKYSVRFTVLRSLQVMRKADRWLSVTRFRSRIPDINTDTDRFFFRQKHPDCQHTVFLLMFSPRHHDWYTNDMSEKKHFRYQKRKTVCFLYGDNLNWKIQCDNFNWKIHVPAQSESFRKPHIYADFPDLPAALPVGSAVEFFN